MEDHIAQGIRRHVIPELIDETRNRAYDRAGIDSLVVVYERCGQTFMDYAGETPNGVLGMMQRASCDLMRQQAKDEREEDRSAKAAALAAV
jgi:hypothetical protein